MIHDTCEIKSDIPDDVVIWNRSQIMENVHVGNETSIGRDVFVGSGTLIGKKCRIQNSCQIFGATIGDNVLLGPGVTLVEDPWPRAFSVCDNLVGGKSDDFVRKPVVIEDGCSVGAGVIVAPGVKLGQYSMIAVGSVVLADVAPFMLVAGNPARPIGEVCKCGRRKTKCVNTND